MALAAGIGAFGSLLSGVASGVMAGHGQYKAYQYNRKLQQQQYDLQQRGYREGPTNARQGFVDAGYNPILALQTGGQFAGSGNAGGVGSIAGTMPDIGTGASNAYRSFKIETQGMNNQTAQTEATVNQANAQAELNKEQALTEQAKRTQMDFQNAMLDVEKHLKDKELSWYDRKVYSEIYDNMQRAENYGAIQAIERYNAKTMRENAITNAYNADTERFDARTRRMNGLSEHNYRQVMANLEGGRYELDKIKAPFQMTRDVYAGIGAGLYGSGSLSTNAKQFRNRSSFDYYRDYDGFNTRRH